MTAVFDLHQGEGPVLVAMPHVGTKLPAEIAARMTPPGQAVTDTDWHVDVLYRTAASLGCSVLTARFSRYVVDLNRGPDDGALYPGRPSTGLVPLLSFDGDPLYAEGDRVTDEEIKARVAAYWRPYHDALGAELQRLHSKWGFAILWDGHSIRSQVPRLFEGRLPDLNFGTHDGAACAPELIARVLEVAAQADYSRAFNGRFKGGYTTRHYGDPAHGIHAIQLEKAQAIYLETEEAPFALDEAKAARLSVLIGRMLEAAQSWRPA
ncbi:MAG: N-formylglutamate deformylase [Parvibaculaceae bacterium]|nr:N-formylglutamate deformylase [Parvibaculaceae bacterium]